MIRVRRSRERHCLHSGGQDLWLTFYPSLRSDPLANGFCSLMALNEGFLEPEGNMLTYSRRGSKTITYVIAGTMSQKSQCRVPTLITAGDFQCSSAEFSDCSIYSNASRREPLHVMQLSLYSNQTLRTAEPEQKSFPALSRAGQICLVGSADGREGSLALGQDVWLYSGILSANQTWGYALAQGRVAWLQVLRGSVRVGSERLGAGDGAGFAAGPSLSVLASTDAEVVLVDLSAQIPLASRFLDNPSNHRVGANSCEVAAARAHSSRHAQI